MGSTCGAAAEQPAWRLMGASSRPRAGKERSLPASSLAGIPNGDGRLSRRLQPTGACN